MIELFTVFLLYVGFLFWTVVFYKILNPPPPPRAVIPQRPPPAAFKFCCYQCTAAVIEKDAKTISVYTVSGWQEYFTCKACIKKIELEDSWAVKEE